MHTIIYGMPSVECDRFSRVLLFMNCFTQVAKRLQLFSVVFFFFLYCFGNVSALFIRTRGNRIRSRDIRMTHARTFRDRHVFSPIIYWHMAIKHLLATHFSEQFRHRARMLYPINHFVPFGCCCWLFSPMYSVIHFIIENNFFHSLWFICQDSRKLSFCNWFKCNFLLFSIKYGFRRLI